MRASLRPPSVFSSSGEIAQHAAPGKTRALDRLNKCPPGPPAIVARRAAALDMRAARALGRARATRFADGAGTFGLRALDAFAFQDPPGHGARRGGLPSRA
eukprot:9466155-Pyramimonas_sp.AAC.1